MYTYLNNKSLEEALEQAISICDWEEYLLLQEEADIRGL